MSDNTCVICLEPLLNAASTGNFGAVTPCGHPFHVDCFGSWEASKVRNYEYGRVKCPTCNCVTKSFTKIFINLTNSAGDGVNDDDSIDTDSDSDDDDDNAGSDEEERDTTQQRGCSQATTTPCAANDDSDVDDDIVYIPTPVNNDGSADAQDANAPVPAADDGVVDLTCSPVHKECVGTKKRKSQHSTSSGEGGDQCLQNFKKRMRRYKQQWKQSKSLAREYHDKQRQLLDKYKEVKDKLEESERDRKDMAVNDHHHRLLIDQLQLEKTTLERKLKEEKLNCTMAKKRMIQATETLLETQKGFQSQLENAQARAVVEVKQISEDLRKIGQENRDLRTTVARRENRLDELEKLLQVKVDQSVRQEIHQHKTESTRQAKKHAKDFHALETEYLREQEETEQQKQRTHQRRHYQKTGKASAHAERISQAANKPSVATKKKSLNDLFDKVDRIEQRGRATSGMKAAALSSTTSDPAVAERPVFGLTIKNNKKFSSSTTGNSRSKAPLRKTDIQSFFQKRG